MKAKLISEIENCFEQFLLLKKEALALNIENYENIPIDDNHHQKENTRKCKYWNQGYCKERRKCPWLHPKDDCQQYLKDGRCRDKDCSNRHRRVCKYWLDEGCTRKKDCQYLHRDVGEEHSILSSPDWKVNENENHTNKIENKTKYKDNNMSLEASKSNNGDLDSTYEKCVLYKFNLLKYTDVVKKK